MENTEQPANEQANPAAPKLGAIVEYIGNNEPEGSGADGVHAAIVTHCYGNDIVDLTIFFRGSPPSARHSVPKEGSEAKTDSPGVWAWPS